MADFKFDWKKNPAVINPDRSLAVYELIPGWFAIRKRAAMPGASDILTAVDSRDAMRLIRAIANLEAGVQ